MADRVISIALFGAGRIGVMHARNVVGVSGSKLAGVADVDGAAAAALVQAVGQGRVATTEELLADPGVDAVLIATPTDTHPELIREAAAAGKHIFCEKPISLDIAATIAATASAQRAGVVLQIGFQRRFDPEFLAARKAIEAGELGEVRYVRLVGRDRISPSLDYIRTSGGQYKDQMVHDFDAARWLLQPAKVEEVVATGSATLPGYAAADDIDTAVACLRFSNGAIAIVEAAREAAYGYDTRAEVHGSLGMLLNGIAPFESGEVAGAPYVNERNDSFIGRFADAYRAEIADFVKVVREGGQPRTGADDALQALRLAIAADRSRRERRAVTLTEIEGG